MKPQESKSAKNGKQNEQATLYTVVEFSNSVRLNNAFTSIDNT